MAHYDLKVINSVRKPYCELCGSPAEGWPHHIKPRGAGGQDIPENLIQLCSLHHTEAHNGSLHRKTLVGIVAKREGVSVEEIYKTNGWLIENTLPENLPTPNPIAGKTFEEILELYFYCLEKSQDSKWERAALITVMHDYMELTPKEIASAVGCSASLCRKMVRVYNTFPSESSRIPVLSFRHHQIAAYTEDPQKWLNDAADNQWSTRVLQEKINESSGIVDKKDLHLEKAEKALRLTVEILEEESEASIWLKDQLKQLVSTPLSA